MTKNILIVLLLGIAAFLFISQRSGSEIKLQDTREIESTNSQDAVTTEEDLATEDKDTEDLMKNANTVDLSDQGLDKLPSSVLSDISLEVLDISNNNLTGALPAEIRQLKNLRVLDASNNDMTGVPAEVGQLSNLEVLDLSNNQLTGLPNEMGNLKNLKTLNLSGNDYSVQDLDVIKQGLSPDVQIIL